MFTMTRAVAVNRPEAAPHLTRAQVWAALCMKARDGRSFVPGMTRCEVLSEKDGVVIRELAVNDGAPFQERVTFHADKLIVFEHISGPQRSVVLNQLESEVGGELMLRYTFLIEVPGMVPGSDAERGLAQQIAKMPMAVDSTLDAIRRMAAAGSL